MKKPIRKDYNLDTEKYISDLEEYAQLLEEEVIANSDYIGNIKMREEKANIPFECYSFNTTGIDCGEQCLRCIDGHTFYE
jgi:hypothetical protein